MLNVQFNSILLYHYMYCTQNGECGATYCFLPVV